MYIYRIILPDLASKQGLALVPPCRPIRIKDKMRSGIPPKSLKFTPVTTLWYSTFMWFILSHSMILFMAL